MKKKTIKIILCALIISSTFLFSESQVQAGDMKNIYLFHGEGCSHCRDIINFLDSVENQIPRLNVVKYEVWNNSENNEIMKEVLSELNYQARGVPVLILGREAHIGFANTDRSKENLTSKIREYINYGNYDVFAERQDDPIKERVENSTLKQESSKELTVTKKEILEKKPIGGLKSTPGITTIIVALSAFAILTFIALKR